MGLYGTVGNRMVCDVIGRYGMACYGMIWYGTEYYGMVWDSMGW